MAVYLEFPKLDKGFPFRCLFNSGDILTTPHWHKEMEIILIKRGEVYLGISDQQYRMVENEVMIINGGEIHYILASPESERLVFQFDHNFFNDITLVDDDSVSPKKIFSSINRYSSSWDSSVEMQVVKLLKGIYEENAQENVGYRYAIKSKLYEILVILLRHVERKHHSYSLPQESTIQSNEILDILGLIFSYIEENYTYPIKLKDAAEVVNYSTFYFTKFFKKYTGKTFISFLNDYRIDKAKWILINETEMPVTEIVGLVGFRSNKTFYRIFKGKMGLPPLAYRRSMLKNQI